jgi:hypothetical protein
MSGWVKWEKDLETDIRFTRLCRIVRDTCHAGTLPACLPHNAIVTLTMGALMKLWSYADTHIRSDDTLDATFDDIDELVGLPGFAAALPGHWLTKVSEECLELPGFQEHNGIVAKKRDQNTKRQQRHRALQKTDPVTPERDNRNAGALPDQTRPDQTKPKEKEGAEAPPPFDPASIPGLDAVAWGLWVEHRKAIKKPIRPHSMTDAAEELAKLGDRQLAEVKRARAGGWQGIHPEEPKVSKFPQPAAPRARMFPS